MRLKVSRGRTDPQFISNLHREQVTALFVLLNQYISTLCTNTCYPTFNIQERIQKIFLSAIKNTLYCFRMNALIGLCLAVLATSAR